MVRHSRINRPLQWGIIAPPFSLEIVNRPAGVKGFQLLPRRWVVERTLAWLNRNRRLAKDFETAIETAEAWIFLASIQLLTRRLARA